MTIQRYAEEPLAGWSNHRKGKQGNHSSANEQLIRTLEILTCIRREGYCPGLLCAAVHVDQGTGFRVMEIYYFYFITLSIYINDKNDGILLHFINNTINYKNLFYNIQHHVTWCCILYISYSNLNCSDIQHLVTANLTI